MWKCKCGEEHEATFDSCWKCGAIKPSESNAPSTSPNQETGSGPKPVVKRPVKGTVLKHWYSLVPGFKTSSQQFYAEIERELKARKVPRLDTARVVFAEGGPLSGKREYLRMTRETLVFDVCSAPFGTGHFFSCRFVDIRSPISIVELIAVLIAFVCVLPAFLFLAGKFWGALIIIGTVLTLVVLMRKAAENDGGDLDAQLLKVPVIGPIYERFFRKETYHREDTRLMYIDTVNDVVKAKVEEVLGTNGIKIIRFTDQKSVLDELYRERTVSIETQPEAAS